MLRLKNPQALRPWLALAAVLLLAFLFYLWLWPQAPVAGNDTNPYLDIARDLRDFRLDEFHVRAPGYPWLLMLSGSAEKPTRLLFIIQLGMYLGLVGFLGWLLRRAGLGWALIGVFTGFALLPYNVMPAAKALTETQAQFLLAFGLGLLSLWLCRGGWLRLLLAAFFLAVLGITRPTFQIFPLALAFLLALAAVFINKWRGRLLWGAAGLTLLAVLIIGGLAWHNYRSHGFFGTTPLFGLNLTQKTARVLELLPDEYARTREVLMRYRDKSLLSFEDAHQFYNYVWEIPMDELRPQPGMSYAQISSYYTRLNLLLIAEAPLSYIQEVGYSLANTFLPVTNALSHFQSAVLQFTWTAAHYLTMLVFFLALLLLGGLGLIWLGLTRERRRGLIAWLDPPARLRWCLLTLALAAFAYNTAVTVLVEMGEPRSRLSVEPLILTLCVLGVDTWLRLRKKQNLPG